MKINNKRQAAKVIAKMIAYNSTEVKDALFESGVDVSPNATDRQIIESVVINIGRNRMLQKSLGEIAVRESEPSSQDYYGGNGLSDDAIAGIATTAGALLGTFIGSRQQKKQNEFQSQQLEQQKELALINSNIISDQLALENAKSGNAGNSGMSTGAKIALGVGAISVVGLVIFLVFKGKKKNA